MISIYSGASTRALPPRRGARAARVAPRRAGVRLGLTIAAVTWAWVAIVDALLGAPFHTATVLGGVLAFTVAHVLLCLALGAALVALMEAAREEPGLVFAVVFGMLLLEVAFAMLTVLISTTALGGGAWLRIFVGSLAGSLVAFALLARWYPLGALVHHAETAE